MLRLRRGYTGARPAPTTDFFKAIFRLYGLHHCRRFSSTSDVAPGRIIPVPVGGNGHVEIEVLPPLKPSPPSSPQSLLIHLPSGPLADAGGLVSSESSSNRTRPIQNVLSSMLPNSPILTIHYRLSSSDHRFPLPIHDTFTAFDHIFKDLIPNMIPRSTSTSDPLIGVYGSHIGGSLALSLALTEPTLLHALAVYSPLTTWVDLEDSDISNIPSRYLSSASTHTRSSRYPTKADQLQSLTQAALHLRQLRHSLFPKPENYFDVFASPALFLRSAPRDCPPETGTLDHKLDSLELTDHSPTASASLLFDSIHSIPKRRRTLKRWPPYSPTRSRSSSPLHQETFPPPTRILIPSYPFPTTTSSPSPSTSTSRILTHQSKEMVDLMRRACFWGREASFAEERIELEEVSVRGEEEGGDIGGLGVEMEMARRGAEWMRSLF